ncbi:phosphoethanolamine transferase domain-containing protein, partial [Salmonella enterica]|uniref:phosphoethanolamine transferase domain-containing protein n=1 Tax=Salmonella enterica TaxID=28901 RepID=UPI0020A47B77
ALVLLMLLNMLGGVLAVGRLLKPVLVALLLLAAACSGFGDRYGIAIDRSMVQNVFETDAVESSELLDAGLLAWLLFAGVLPA